MKVKILVMFLWLFCLIRAQVPYETQGTDGIGQNINVCETGKNCQNSNCSVGMTCQVDEDEENGCYKCHNCVKNQKHFSQLESNASYQTNVECVEINISCHCPEWTPTATTNCITNDEVQSKSEGEGDMTDQVFFAWTLFAISLLTNLILAAILLHQQCHRSNNIITLAEITPMNDYRLEHDDE